MIIEVIIELALNVYYHNSIVFFLTWLTLFLFLIIFLLINLEIDNYNKTYKIF